MKPEEFIEKQIALLERSVKAQEKSGSVLVEISKSLDKIAKLIDERKEERANE